MKCDGNFVTLYLLAPIPWITECKFTQKLRKKRIKLPLKDNISPNERPQALTPDPEIERLYPPLEESSRLLVSCIPADYSASRIARAVEDCDAQLLALSVTSMRDAAGRPVVMLRVNTRNSASIERSLARYGYETIFSRGDLSEGEQTEARARINELLRYLEM